MVSPNDSLRSNEILSLDKNFMLATIGVYGMYNRPILTRSKNYPALKDSMPAIIIFLDSGRR